MFKQLNKIIVTTVILTFWLILYFLNTTKPLNKNHLFVHSFSKLDLIQSDEVPENTIKKARHNNFIHLKGMSLNEIKHTSVYYSIEQINENLFLIKPKWSGRKFRDFSLLAKFKNEKLVDFITFFDTFITSYINDEKQLYLLLSDYSNRNEFWKTKYEFDILKMNDQLDTIWKYHKNLNEPLYAEKLKLKNDTLSLQVDVITGCEICFISTLLKISNTGKFISIEVKSNNNSEPLSEKYLVSQFQ